MSKQEKQLNDLIKSYVDAEYHVDDFEQPIMVGQKSEELNAIMEEHGVVTWSLITAFNPASERNLAEANETRNQKLKEDLRGYTVFEAEGRDKTGQWEPERSFLVLGIDRDTTILLAEKYGQLAILFGNVNSEAEMIFREEVGK